MPQPIYYVNKDNNNPSKEIWANSGIYDQKSYGPLQYAPDIENAITPNTGISLRTTPPPLTPPLIQTDSALLSAPAGTFSSGNYFVDNMDLFNPFRHHSIRTMTFDPQDFLIETVNVFNVYSRKYRI
jgi:hypothetical protein